MTDSTKADNKVTHTGNACCMGSIKAKRLMIQLSTMHMNDMFFWQTVRSFNEAVKDCEALRVDEDYKALRRILLMTNIRQKANLRRRGLGIPNRSRHSLAA